MNSNRSGFYLTLPSDVSKGLFPNNNPSEYTVRLPQWIQLQSDYTWEIGLHSISYTPWNIIQSLDQPLTFIEGGKEGKGGKMRKHYSSVNEYVTSLNESLKQAYVGILSVDKSNDIVFSYLLNGKVKVTLSSGHAVRLRREQAIVLGFITYEDSAETYDINKTETGTYDANTYRETNIHVYCDIVQPQIVGDKMSPLLAVVPCQKTTKYETYYAVENIHYIPVQTKSFQNVNIHLKSSTNEIIPFQYGRATVTLHVRPLNYFD